LELSTALGDHLVFDITDNTPRDPAICDYMLYLTILYCAYPVVAAYAELMIWGIFSDSLRARFHHVNVQKTIIECLGYGFLKIWTNGLRMLCNVHTLEEGASSLHGLKLSCHGICSLLVASWKMMRHTLFIISSHNISKSCWNIMMWLEAFRQSNHVQCLRLHDLPKAF
jgi:hypothetical protein